MPPKEIAKRRLSKEHQKRQEDIRNESSENRQPANITETTSAEESMAEQQSWLESNRFSKLQTKQRQILKRTETAMYDNKQQSMSELYRRYKTTEPQEQPERRLEQTLALMSRLRIVETEEQHEKMLEQHLVCDRPITASKTPEQLERRLKCARIRLRRLATTETREQHEKTMKQTRARMSRLGVGEEEHKRTLECQRIRYRRMKETEIPEEIEGRLERMHLWGKPTRAAETPEERARRRVLNQQVRKTETPEERKARFEKFWELYALKKNITNNEDVLPVEPPVVIKVEPVEFVPEPSTSAEIVTQNVKKDHGDAVPVQAAVFIKQEPIEIDPQPSASADMVMKDEFVASNEDCSGSSAYYKSRGQHQQVLKSGLSKDLEKIKDYFNVFGEQVKLKGLDNRSIDPGCDVANSQKAIGDIAFDAEMEKYGNIYKTGINRLILGCSHDRSVLLAENVTKDNKFKLMFMKMSKTEK
ncbi:hypothetical protein CDAR_470751 [Caerostris darwini]|uniref:Uncharacterized protein n=1 Tax=Caerostris darwini TaxID=1538125 RepID=A0AAV4VIR0_9ARAC|nr:hypothetical protein CDAR_470751 [Caerostris darwini]